MGAKLQEAYVPTQNSFVLKDSSGVVEIIKFLNFSINVYKFSPFLSVFDFSTLYRRISLPDLKARKESSCE